MEQVLKAAMAAKQAERKTAVLDAARKNRILLSMADALIQQTPYLIQCNELDLQAAKAKGMGSALLDRLRLTPERIGGMAEGLRQIASLTDPVGEIVHATKRENGLMIGKKRVPLGVIGIIYEARPNVTADAIGLCLKTGNTVVLRGGSEAIHSNMAVAKVCVEAGRENGLPEGAVNLIEDTTREAAAYLMTLNDYLDVLIPRGGAGLIQSVVKNATVPVIQTGVGNCHIYVESSADFRMAEDIVINAKTQRPAVCNAAESLLVDEAIAGEFLPHMAQLLKEKKVEIRGCEKTREKIDCVPATEEDYATEFLDTIISVKVVSGIDEAMAHIDRYGTKHSEAIITNDYRKAKQFQNEVDAAAVYVNASTRFTDGFEFGFGAEIGISTQKLHARGPMGLNELTTFKYVIDGNGQIRK